MPRHQRTTIERLTLQARIWGWDMSWSFSSASAKDFRLNGSVYSEHTALTLFGSVRYPEAFKYPTLECYLCADPLLHFDKSAPRCIGSMRTVGKRLVVYVPVHNERLESLISAANRLVALEISAEPLRYRKSKVMGIHLTSELEPDWL